MNNILLLKVCLPDPFWGLFIDKHPNNISTMSKKFWNIEN